jgi:uncharacterized repeat protein (TIGR03803 family)
MPTKNLSIGFAVLLAIFAATIIMTATPAVPQTEKVLYSFMNDTASRKTPVAPLAGVIFDASGHLYGTTLAGGAYFGGTVFELTKMCGSWTEKTLYSFGGDKDGSFPHAGLILDAAGNLYGTTTKGGAYGGGTVYELSPKDSGGWREKILHSFGGGEDGLDPQAGLIFDASGSLYGTTYGGGSGTNANCQSINYYGTTGCGTAFELKPSGDGEWDESILYNFGSSNEDASNPYAALIFDAAGNLYGTTFAGGTICELNGTCGTAFELTPTADGGWTEKILYYFGKSLDDASNPQAGLIFDAAGNLFGTTGWGGGCGHGGDEECGGGTVFELTPVADGEWTEKILHNFQGSPTDGNGPAGGLIFDAAGNLYGATYGGGTTPQCFTNSARCGTVYELKPTVGGIWDSTLLHSFGGDHDGDQLFAGLIFNAAGNLYGTTAAGGAYNSGTVFEITP